MRRPYLYFALAVAAAACFGADFWEKKKFPDWSSKDAEKIIKDSPWAQKVDMSMGGGGGSLPGGGGGGRGGRGGGGGGGGMPGGGGGGGADAEIGGGGGGGGMAGGGGGGMSGGAPAMSFMVRWHSALPLKHAIAKLKYGDEAGTSPKALEMINRKEVAYVVGITGLPGGMLRGNPENLKKGISLNRKGEDPLLAANVQGEKDEASGKANLYLFFPRTEGQTIELEDKEVELVVKLGPMEIKRKFRLKDMVYEGKLEL